MKNTQKTPSITIDELALMVKKGFDAMDLRFEAMEKRFEARFDAVDDRFDRLEAKFDALDSVVRDHTVRIRRIERKTQLA